MDEDVKYFSNALFLQLAEWARIRSPMVPFVQPLFWLIRLKTSNMDRMHNTIKICSSDALTALYFTLLVCQSVKLYNLKTETDSKHFLTILDNDQDEIENWCQGSFALLHCFIFVQACTALFVLYGSALLQCTAIYFVFVCWTSEIQISWVGRSTRWCTAAVHCWSEKSHRAPRDT